MSRRLGEQTEEEEEEEKEPLLGRNSWRELTISDETEVQEHIRVQYGPKLPVFSPGKLAILLCILMTELCERMAFYGVTANLVLYCTSVLEFSSNTGTTISLVFSGTVYVIPIIGGYIADAWSSGFNVIYGSAMIYVCGLFLLMCSSIHYNDLFSEDLADMDVDSRRAYYITGLVLVAMGTGGIKANVGPFGAHQVQDLGPEAVQVYFNWFYWFINAGGLIAYSAIAYVQQNVNFSWGYLIPLLCMLLSVIFLNVARRFYIYKHGQGNILSSTFHICGQACTKQSPLVDGKRHLFDSARREYGGSHENYMVDGVIAVVRIIPIFVFITMFSAIYFQMQSTYFLQGERMDLRLGGSMLPVAILNVFNIVAALLTIPLLDRLVYPCFRKLGRPLTYLQRIGVGLILSACSVCLAGWVEIGRKKQLGFQQNVGDEVFFASNMSVFVQAPQFLLIGAGESFTIITGVGFILSVASLFLAGWVEIERKKHLGFWQNVGDEVFFASNMSVFMQVPQFVVLGLGKDTFAYTAGYEFAFTQAPKNMQGVMTGLFLATTGIGSYVSLGILGIIGAATSDDPWLPNDINDGKAENVFFVFGGLMVVFILGYIPTAYFYKYQGYLTDGESEIKAPGNDPDETSKKNQTLL